MFRRTRPAYQEHEGAKADLKKLMPEDAKEAIGHGLYQIPLIKTCAPTDVIQWT